MKLQYADLMSGDPIPVQGIGHIRSPKLKELKPTTGIGMWKYQFYLNVLSWNIDELIHFMRISTNKQLKALDKANKISLFDLITLLDIAKGLFAEAIGFFMVEHIKWSEEDKCFLTFNKDGELVGFINGENFEEIRGLCMQANFINPQQKAKTPIFPSKAAEIAWNRAQEYLRKSGGKKKDEKMDLGNIISKLCAVGIGYTLLNIYELTVFQLYDQFFQYGYLRMVGINERAYSFHGGKKFDLQGWLKPLSND